MAIFTGSQNQGQTNLTGDLLKLAGASGSVVQQVNTANRAVLDAQGEAYLSSLSSKVNEINKGGAEVTGSGYFFEGSTALSKLNKGASGSLSLKYPKGSDLEAVANKYISKGNDFVSKNIANYTSKDFRFQQKEYLEVSKADAMNNGGINQFDALTKAKTGASKVGTPVNIAVDNIIAGKVESSRVDLIQNEQLFFDAINSGDLTLHQVIQSAFGEAITTDSEGNKIESPDKNIVTVSVNKAGDLNYSFNGDIGSLNERKLISVGESFVKKFRNYNSGQVKALAINNDIAKATIVSLNNGTLVDDLTHDYGKTIVSLYDQSINPLLSQSKQDTARGLYNKLFDSNVISNEIESQIQDGGSIASLIQNGVSALGASGEKIFSTPEQVQQHLLNQANKSFDAIIKDPTDSTALNKINDLVSNKVYSKQLSYVIDFLSGEKTGNTSAFTVTSLPDLEASISFINFNSSQQGNGWKEENHISDELLQSIQRQITEGKDKELSGTKMLGNVNVAIRIARATDPKLQAKNSFQAEVIGTKSDFQKRLTDRGLLSIDIQIDVNNNQLADVGLMLANEPNISKQDYKDWLENSSGTEGASKVDDALLNMFTNDATAVGDGSDRRKVYYGQTSEGQRREVSNDGYKNSVNYAKAKVIQAFSNTGTPLNEDQITTEIRTIPINARSKDPKGNQSEQKLVITITGEYGASRIYELEQPITSKEMVNATENNYSVSDWNETLTRHKNAKLSLEIDRQGVN